MSQRKPASSREPICQLAATPLVLVVNGYTTVVPLRLQNEYNVSPFKALDGLVDNTPPIVRVFDEKAPGVQGPVASMRTATARTATVASGLELPVWVEDDAKYASNSGARPRNPPPPASIRWAQFRGPAAVTFDSARPRLDVLAGGKIDEPFKGKGTATAKFPQPGEYVLLVTASDYSAGGGRAFCCWTTSLVKVTVTQ